jgi:NADPH2:quinone reductase
MGAGVNPVDTYRRQGIQNYARTGPWPYTPGSDGAGVIHSIGPEVKKFSPGNRVFLFGSVSGTYAQYCICNDDQVESLPENVTFDQGAGLWSVYATAYQALYHVGALDEILKKKNGTATVFIHGASGGVGTAAVQWLRGVPGVTIIGTAGTPAGSELLKKEGVHHVLNHRTEDYMKDLATFTNGKGPDLILEMLANVNLDRDLKAIAARGRIVIIGSRGPVEITPRDLMGKRCIVIGLSFYTATSEEMQETKAAVTKALADGRFNVVVGKTYKLSDAAQAHIDIMATEGSQGKIILHPWDE